MNIAVNHLLIHDVKVEKETFLHKEIVRESGWFRKIINDDWTISPAEIHKTPSHDY